MLYCLHTGVRQTWVLATEGAVCGMFLMKILWCLVSLSVLLCFSLLLAALLFSAVLWHQCDSFLVLFFMFVLFFCSTSGVDAHRGIYPPASQWGA